MPAQIDERLLLVGTHHAVVARHIGKQDGGEVPITDGIRRRDRSDLR